MAEVEVKIDWLVTGKRNVIVSEPFFSKTKSSDAGHLADSTVSHATENSAFASLLESLEGIHNPFFLFIIDT